VQNERMDESYWWGNVQSVSRLKPSWVQQGCDGGSSRRIRYNSTTMFGCIWLQQSLTLTYFCGNMGRQHATSKAKL
jgi:hypothetical protein